MNCQKWPAGGVNWSSSRAGVAAEGDGGRTVVCGPDEGYPFDELPGSITTDGASVYKTEAPFALVLIQPLDMIDHLTRLTISDVHSFTPSSDFIIVS